MDRTMLGLLLIISTTIGSPVTTGQNQNKNQFCSTILNFNNFFYSLDEQKNISGIPADMTVNWKTGDVFYTLIREEMKMNLQILRPNGESEMIKVAGLGQSTAVDNLNDIVYLATDNGVYKYKDDGSIELYTAKGEDVMYVAVNSGEGTIYIATWPQNRVHKITDGGQKQEMFSNIPNGHGLTIDTRNNIFFVATKTLYVLKNEQSIPIKIKGLPSDRMTGVFVSKSDDVFGMDENGNFYAIDVEDASARHIGSFNVTGVNTFAMDSADNILVGIKGAILKFKAYHKNPCIDHEKNSQKNRRHSRRRKQEKITTTTTEANEEDYEE